ncbi:MULTISPECIES: SDR family NAD(P)-dependent oxidoreductase [Klebsiella]|uniref:SDR family NAD(P)-dependent oxidoreductase n=1 Tax=Klebsiella TaxID=570 RepID=UPI000B41E0DC|nr:SDR family oxidoreductase [Klebsiella pasteurii]MDX7158051.1 SDR family oxidoreductase [Klebsiella pasteurii]OVU30675.1 oxidoreductase [Klebsiella michiganensis]VUT14804.1 Diacetyl reductase [(S)-acetoin forming] [Klebsiella pasteurii]
MSKKFANKVVVITGGSEGIGLATARLFSEEGAHVYVTARRQAQLEVAVQKIGHGAVGVQGDVADPASLDRLYKRIREEHGRIDVLFANAGISESASLDDIDETHIDRIFNVNVKGTIFTVQKALALMSAGSTIILPGSIAGSKGIPSLSIYSATKAAIRSFARTWTTDLKSRGIRVNVVSPGIILTPAMHAYFGTNTGAEETLKNMSPFGRVGQVDEVARAVLFLASTDSEFIAGNELFVDGGIMAV